MLVQRAWKAHCCWDTCRGYIMSAVDDSPKRLRTDYIDLYQVHQVDPLTPMEETLRALAGA